MFCQSCGNEVLDTSVVCIKCGSPMKKKTEIENWSNANYVGLIVASFLFPFFGFIFGTYGLFKGRYSQSFGIYLFTIISIGIWIGING